MTASRIKVVFAIGLLTLFVLPAGAQTPDEPSSINSAASPAVTDGRDASFLPPTPLAPTGTAASPASTNNGPPPLSLPATAPTPTVTPALATPAVIEKPNAIGVPVESGILPGVDPDATGILTAEGGGLGSAMWKGTPYELVNRMLPTLMLPVTSPALNGLAERFLLTTANVPEGDAAENGQSLTAMRVEKLVMLGDAADAWNLATLVKPGQIDEITLRLATEAALVSPANKDVCAKLPALVQTYTSPEWQKSLVVCQLRANDSAAAQLALEVLHAQNVKDDTFFQLAEHNIIGGSKSLPRQLTPLKPLNLALLQIVDQPLPPEVYAHPDTAAISELLKAKARDENAHIALAERAAARGIISGSALADIYRSLVFSPDDLANPFGGKEAGPKRRARLYQAALQEKIPAQRFADVDAFVQGLDALTLNGAARIVAEMIGNTSPSGDYASHAVTAMRIFILAGKPSEALGWLKTARQAVAAAPDIGLQLQDAWPLIVLSGIESDDDYGRTFAGWLDAALKNADRDRREQVGDLLLLFDAAGFAVPESAWARVVDQADGSRRLIPPSALLLERLRAAGLNNRRGEAVLIALAMTDTTGNEASLLPTIETIRALRLVGLAADSLSLARETALVLLMPSTTKPQ
jgi:hypothetical protein